MRNSFFKAVLIFSMVICFSFSSSVYAEEIADSPENSIDMDYFEGVMKMVKEKYKGQVTDKELLEGALKGIFDSMDPYTTYFTNEEAQAFLEDIEGTYEGIGVSFSQEGNSFVVMDVFESSPAEDAGIIEGDIIVEVNGESVSGKATEQLAGLIKGKEGTKVNLSIMRKGINEFIKVEVLRKKIEISPVTFNIKGDIGYIRLDVFNSNASKFINAALKEMDNKNIKKIILDLRDNPGGEVSEAVAIAKKFIPEGLITRLDFKSEKQKDQEYYSSLKQLKYKVAVLVNNMSASASEILAGAIQDTKAGTLIGTKTFGKGKVQNFYPVLSPEAYRKYEKKLGVEIINANDLMINYNIEPTDDEIIGWTKITTGEYYTPKGRMIDGTGLEPDIFIESANGKIDVRTIKKLKKRDKPTLASNSVEVFNAEKILIMSGYDVDTPDMKMDQKTFEAIKKFQAQCGFYPYGVLDFSTQQALNEKLEKLLTEEDNQYSKALEVLRNN